MRHGIRIISLKMNVLLANKIDDSCPELSKIKVLKMLDLQTKSAINLYNSHV